MDKLNNTKLRLLEKLPALTEAQKELIRSYTNFIYNAGYNDGVEAERKLIGKNIHY